MSNSVVGAIYQNIIEDVISTTRVDFEENGVDESVLNDLRAGWQRKLSQFNVAQFPWEPKPEPVQPQAQVQTIVQAQNAMAGSTQPRQDVGYVQQGMNMNQPASDGLPMPNMPNMPMPAMGMKPDGQHPQQHQQQQQQHQQQHQQQQQGVPGVKMEPGLQQGPGLTGIPTTIPMPQQHQQGQQQTHVPAPSVPAFSMPAGGNGNAAARAVQHMQKSFGQRAAASISATQSGQAQFQQQQQQQQMGQMQQMTPQQLTAAQYRAAQMNGSNGLSKSQVDGSTDMDELEPINNNVYEGVLMQQRADGKPAAELGRVEIDGLLHEQMMQRAKQMEGGGLMLPLREATKHSRRTGTTASTRKARSSQMGQTDGVEDDDDDEVKAKIMADEDAINSDLDDPDEELEEEDEEDDVMAPIMLCVYDKVARVKNKWKCTLKDGVLTVNGKEYVFHKATGEFEW